MLNISRKFSKISKNVIYAHRYIWSLIPVHVTLLRTVYRDSPNAILLVSGCAVVRGPVGRGHQHNQKLPAS